MQCYIKYFDGKIYYIKNKCKPSDLRIGSTIRSLSARFGDYVSAGDLLSKYMKDQGIENFTIHLLEKFPCNDEKELHKREQYYIALHRPNLNYMSAYKSYVFAVDDLKKYSYLIENPDNESVCICGLKISKRSSHISTWNHQHMLKIKMAMFAGKMPDKKDFENGDKQVCECFVSVQSSSMRDHLESGNHAGFMSLINKWKPIMEERKKVPLSCNDIILNQLPTIEYCEYGIIYKITNLLTGEVVYVGSTRRTIYERKLGHDRDSKTSNSAIYKELRKIGLENFEITFVEDTKEIDREKIREREDYWAKILNPTMNTDTIFVAGVKNEKGIKIIECECGLQTDIDHRIRHMETKEHKWLISIKNEIIDGKHANISGYQKNDNGSCTCECYLETNCFGDLQKHVKYEDHMKYLNIICEWLPKYDHRQDIVKYVSEMNVSCENDFVLCDCNINVIRKNMLKHRATEDHMELLRISSVIELESHGEKDKQSINKHVCDECYAQLKNEKSLYYHKYKKGYGHKEYPKLIPEIRRNVLMLKYFPRSLCMVINEYLVDNN